MTMKNTRKAYEPLRSLHELFDTKKPDANRHCSDSSGSVIELEKAHEYQLQPAPSDFDEQPKPPSTYRKPRSKYAPHIGAKEPQRLSQNIEESRESSS